MQDETKRIPNLEVNEKDARNKRVFLQTPEPAWELYVASQVYNFKRYGEYCMDIVEKILKGETLQAEYFPNHYMIDRKNAFTDFAEFFN